LGVPQSEINQACGQVLGLGLVGFRAGSGIHGMGFANIQCNRDPASPSENAPWRTTSINHVSRRVFAVRRTATIVPMPACMRRMSRAWWLAFVSIPIARRFVGWLPRS
jgi:hypothetical protein